MKKITIMKIEKAIDLHENMRNSYFWTSYNNANSRQSYEKNNSLTTEFTHNKEKIKVVQETTCSCKNIYYKMKIFVNGKETNKDVRFLKKMIKA